MGKKRKERTVAELYKRTVKLSKPRITPILEGNCRIQGPLDESDSEFETDTVCSTGERSLEVNLSEHMECSISMNAAKRRRNKEQDGKIKVHHNTGDTLLSEKETTGKELLSELTTSKSATKDFVKREEMPGSKKTRMSSNVRRTKGNKSRKAGIASSLSDYGQKGEIQAISMIEQIEKSLETPDASQSNDKEKILSLGKQSEETCDKSRKAGIVSSHSDNKQKAEIQATSRIEQSENFLETPDASRSKDEEKIHSLGKQSGETYDKSRKEGITSSHSDYGQKAEIEATSMIEQSEKSLEIVGASQSNDGNIVHLGKQSEETCDKSRKVGISRSHSEYGRKAKTQATSMIEKSEKSLETPGFSQSNDEEEIFSIGKQSEETCDKSTKAGIGSSHSDYGQKAEIQATSTTEQSEKSQLNDVEKILSLGKQSGETCNKSRKEGMARSHLDYGQKSEIQETSSIEQSEKSLETPGASHSKDEEKILSHGKQSEGTCDKFFDKEPTDVLQSNEMPVIEDIEVHDDERYIGKQEEDDKELPLTKSNDASNINSRNFDSVGTTSCKNDLDTCNMAPIIVLDEINESKDSPGIQLPMPFCSDSDIHVPGSENNAGIPQIHVNGVVCNNKHLTERQVISNFSRLENTDKLANTESLLSGNVLLKETSGSPHMINAETTSTLGLPRTMNCEKATSVLTEFSVDVTQKVEAKCNASEFLPQNNNIQIRTPESSNLETTTIFSDNSFSGHGLSVNGVEPVNLSVDCGPLDHFSSSSPEKRESSNRFISDGNLSQEAVSSFPLSVTPGNSCITSASQSVTTAKEIEAHSICQQEEDFSLTSVCVESSTTKNTIIVVEEAKDVLPVAARSPEHLQSVTTTKDVEAHSICQQEEDFSLTSVCVESSTTKNTIIVVEEAKDILPVAATSPEHLQNDSLKRNDLNQDFNFGEASKRVGLSELSSSSGVSLPCEETEKSCGPLSGEDDVKACDICGNTGYEAMLAVCSLCNDGAEHTYCMEPMLDEVPESDWLCGGCKLKQNVNVKMVETPPSLTIISKPMCLNARKQNSYGTARSRLSAKLDKKKFVPERKRALKGIPSSLLSTKRRAETFEAGPATKKLSLGTSTSNLGSLSSNPKPTFSRENSFKAPDIGKVKTSIAVSSTVNLPDSSVHDSGKSSTLYGVSSPRLPANVQLSKNRLSSVSGRMNDSSVVTGTSKASRNAPTHTVKMSTDPSPPLRLNSFHKLSASPKVVKDSNHTSWLAKADRENTSSSQLVGGIAKPLKCNMNTDLSTVLESRTATDVHNFETKEMRTGKVTKDGPGPLRKKVMSKSLSIGRDSKPAGAVNLEKLAMDDRYAKPVTFPMKDSPKSRPVSSEAKKPVAPIQVPANSNKDHNSLMFSVEGRTQLKTSPSKLQGVTANKLQRSASIEAFHKGAAEKSEEKSLLERTFSVKSVAEEVFFSSSVRDDKMSNSLGELVTEGHASQYDKKVATPENKLISNDHPPEENKRTGNFKNFSSLRWPSPNYLTAAGSTRCYKCKELGHSAQLCTNRSFAEAGSSSLRVSNLIASPARSLKDMPDTVSGKLSTLEETASLHNYKACGNDQNSEQRLQQSNSQQDHVQQPGSGSPTQVSSNKEASYANQKSNSIESFKGTTDLSREFDIKSRESCQVSTPCRDFGRGLTNSAQTLTSGLQESSLVNPTCTSSKAAGEKISHTGFNEKKKSGVDDTDSQKDSTQKGLLEGEASFHPGDSSHVATAITHHTDFPEEDTVVAIKGNSSCSVPAPLDGTGLPGTEFGVVPCRESSPVEPTKATSLPEHNFLWQGGFYVQSNKNCTHYFEGIQAHASTSAAPKVLDAARKFSSKLRLEEVPRYSSWPLQFHRCHPSDKNIALYFFAKDHESYERPYRKLLEHMLKNDLALRGNFDGVELLVFPSNQLAEKSQRWNRLLFLWGVFRERKSTCIESSTCTSENIQGESAKGDTLGSSNLNINDSSVVHHSSSVLGYSAFEEMDTDGDGDRESNASEGTLRLTGDRILPSVSSQGEGQNGNYSDPNVPNSLVEDKKVYRSLKIDKKAAEHSSVKKHSMGSSFESNEQPSLKSLQSIRLNYPDLPVGFETSTTHKLHNGRDTNFLEEMIPPEAGLAASGKCGEISSSRVFSQTERTKPNILRHSLSATSAIGLSSTERKAYSCDTSRNAHFHSDSSCHQANIDKGKKRPRDIECDRQMERTKETESTKLSCGVGEMDQGLRPSKKYREDRVVANEREISLSREEDYGNCESKYQRDRMLQRKRSCPSRSHSPPQIGVQSHTSTKKIYNYDFEYSRTHSPDLDHIKKSPRRQVSETIPEHAGSYHEKSSNNIAVDEKEGRRKVNKSYSDVRGRENGKEQVTTGMRLAEQKMSSLPSYHIADLNQAADFDFAVEFPGASVHQHILQDDPESYLPFPQDSQLTERVFFPYSDDISRNHRLSKLSEQWPIELGSKQNSPESSSTIRLISTEENRERLDLNMPNLELDLGGRKTSLNPIKSSSLEGTESGSSLALSLAYPLSQNDQTANTQKEDYKKPANCSVNTSFCLFGHRLNG